MILRVVMGEVVVVDGIVGVATRFGGWSIGGCWHRLLFGMGFAVSDTGADECMREGRWVLGLMKLEMKAADGGKARVGRPGMSALDRLRQVIDSPAFGTIDVRDVAAETAESRLNRT